MFLGLIDLPWWGYVIVALILTQITIASVTIFLHRHQAHRALSLHAIPSHFFRFWLWLTTAIITKEWVAIHRKHHAKCETADDPHSPIVLGIKKVLLEGAALYQQEARNLETLATYGHGTPDDWLESNIYSGRSELGIVLMLMLDVLLFGPIGLTIWAAQMAWIPINAAGIVNGIGHYWGYRNFHTEDASTNIVPWGIFIGGEELHNNHHTYASSAKLSNKWYEIDIGWFYICVLQALGMAKVKRRPPRVILIEAKASCDLETLHAVIANRYEVAARYAKLLKNIYAAEMARLQLATLDKIDVARIRHWLHLDERLLTEQQKIKLNVVIKSSAILQMTYTLRQELVSVWHESSDTKDQLVQQLEDWCHRAEGSGVAVLREFSRRLRCYA